MSENITCFEKLVCTNTCFSTLGAISGFGGYENRSPDGLLHLLVVGNIWGVISNRFSEMFSDFYVFQFVKAIYKLPKFGVFRYHSMGASFGFFGISGWPSVSISCH